MRSISSPLALIALLALLGACVGPATAPPQPRPASPPPASAEPATPAPANTSWLDKPMSPGTWTYAAEGGGSRAQFGPPAGGALLSVKCDSATRRVSFLRAGSGQGPMVIRTSFGATSWPATPGAQTVATRAANDATLDQIAYSRGRFAVEVAGLAPLIAPPWAELARVIEDCRG